MMMNLYRRLCSSLCLFDSPTVSVLTTILIPTTR